MTIKTNQIIESVCSKDETRNTLTQPYLDVSEGKLVATEGRCMVILDAPCMKSEKSGHIPIEALTSAREAKGVHYCDECGTEHPTEEGTISLICADDVGAPKATFHRGDYGNFPKYKQVIPEPGRPEIVYAVNLELLARVASALGTTKVYLHVPNDPTHALVVESQENPKDIGIVMPMKM